LLQVFLFLASFSSSITFEEAVQSSSLVARIEILEKHPIKYRKGAVEDVCGFEYEARVAEELKGTGGTIRFFSEYDVEPSKSSQYFAIVHTRSRREVELVLTKLREIATDADEMARWRCVMEGEATWVSARPRMLVIIHRGEKAEDPDWLEKEPDTIVWTTELPDHSTAGQRRIDWSSVKQAVGRIVRASQR
jgi:hypothetical protein